MTRKYWDDGRWLVRDERLARVAGADGPSLRPDQHEIVPCLIIDTAESLAGNRRLLGRDSRLLPHALSVIEGLKPRITDFSAVSRRSLWKQGEERNHMR